MRTIVHYGGQEYIVGQGAAELKAAVGAILAAGEPGWLPVNHGRGQLRVAELLIMPGIPIGLVDSSDPEEPA